MKTLKIEQNGLTQTIQLHDDYKVTVDDEVIVIEQKEYVPKAGDYVKITYSDGNFYFLEIFNARGKEIVSKNIFIRNEEIIEENGVFSIYKSIKEITPEQLQEEFNKLGYNYDFTTHTASKIKWIPKKGEKYFCIGVDGITNHFYCDDSIDKFKLSINDFHKTKEDAEKFIQYLKDYEPNK